MSLVFGSGSLQKFTTKTMNQFYAQLNLGNSIVHESEPIILQLLENDIKNVLRKKLEAAFKGQDALISFLCHKIGLASGRGTSGSFAVGADGELDVKTIAVLFEQVSSWRPASESLG